VKLRTNKQFNIRCQRCRHEWQYKGSNQFFTLCPHCRTTVRMKNKIEPLQSIQVGDQGRTAVDSSSVTQHEDESMT
jgi:hypothetical protein